MAHDCPQATSRMAVERALCPLLPTTLPDFFHTGQPVLIGLQVTHGSHKLAYKRGIWWCVVCGSWASSAARNLSRPCTGQSTKAARDVSGSFGQGAHAATPRPVAVSASLKGASMRFGVWDPHGNPGRRPKDRAQRFGVIRMKPRALAQEPRRGSCSFA